MPPSDKPDVSPVQDALDSPGEPRGGDRVTRRVGSDERVSTAVLVTVAELLDVDPTTLTPPMHEVIDPEALDRLFDRSDGRTASLRTEFELYGCRVAVDDDRRLHVRRIR